MSSKPSESLLTLSLITNPVRLPWMPLRIGSIPLALAAWEARYLTIFAFSPGVGWLAWLGIMASSDAILWKRVAGLGGAAAVAALGLPVGGWMGGVVGGVGECRSSGGGMM